MNPQIEYAAHRSHLDDVARSARHAHRGRCTTGRRLTREHEVAIRSAGPADEAALTLLAALDCARVPRGHVLLASVDGELRAAVQVDDGTAVADPFAPTLEVVELLRVRAERLRNPRAATAPRAGMLRRLTRRLA